MTGIFLQAQDSTGAVPDTTAMAPVPDAPDRIDLLTRAFWADFGSSVVEAVIIALVAWLLVRLVVRATRRWMRRFEDLPAIDPRRQRALTVGNLLQSAARYLIWPLAIVTIVSEFGVNMSALIATAGFAGLALGFGAQTLVKDVISGIFLLFDDTIHVGDIISFNGQTGQVEHVGVRLIQMRRYDGELVMIPAGELRVFGNRSVEYARVLVEIGVSYEQDLEDILRELHDIALEWAGETRAVQLDEEPEVQSVLSFGDSSVTVRVASRVVPGEQWQAERALRRLIKRRFDERGIEIPFPRRTVYTRQEPSVPPRSVPPASA